jgi:hypothetical protein
VHFFNNHSLPGKNLTEIDFLVAHTANPARAQAVLGDKGQANVNIDKVLKINPNFAPAMVLKDKINSMAFEQTH